MKKGLLPTFTFEAVKKTVDDFGLTIVLDEFNQTITIDKKTVFQILKVFNDDYLTSQHTQNRYEVASKTARGTAASSNS